VNIDAGLPFAGFRRSDRSPEPALRRWRTPERKESEVNETLSHAVLFLSETRESIEPWEAGRLPQDEAVAAF
jgi:hypothetical protein